MTASEEFMLTLILIVLFLWGAVAYMRSITYLELLIKPNTEKDLLPRIIIFIIMIGSFGVAYLGLYLFAPGVFEVLNESSIKNVKMHAVFVILCIFASGMITEGVLRILVND